MVADEELLYRRIVFRVGLEPFKIVDGKLRFGSQAFGDRTLKPSVDRAALNGNDPTRTQQQPANGETARIRGDIRKIASVTRKEDNDQVAQFSPDVVPDPITPAPGVEENPAHALVVTNPPVPNPNIFHKLQLALSELGSARGWVIPPA